MVRGRLAGRAIPVPCATSRVRPVVLGQAAPIWKPAEPGSGRSGEGVRISSTGPSSSIERIVVAPVSEMARGNKHSTSGPSVGAPPLPRRATGRSLSGERRHPIGDTVPVFCGRRGSRCRLTATPRSRRVTLPYGRHRSYARFASAGFASRGPHWEGAIGAARRAYIAADSVIMLRGTCSSTTCGTVASEASFSRDGPPAVQVG